MTIVEQAPAKLNLFLHVVGRRPDGYHLLETLFVFVSVGDELIVEPGEGLQLSIEGPYAGRLAAEPDNLVLRAGKALAQAAGLDRARARISLRKNLPIAAGLGGGSADAAAALRALNRLWALDWTLAQLADVAAELGADVPACVHSRPAIGRGTGTELEFVELAGEAFVVLVNPGVPLSTAEVFRQLHCSDQPLRPELGGSMPKVPSVEWAAAQTNDLQAAARACCPPMAQMADELKSLPGAMMIRMAGSGPTWFAVFPSRAAAEASAAELRCRYPQWWIAEAQIA